MKLQLSILVIIAVLSAYIYFTKNRDEAGEQLLGSRLLQKYQMALKAWRQEKGSARMPTKTKLLKWYDALVAAKKAKRAAEEKAKKAKLVAKEKAKKAKLAAEQRAKSRALARTKNVCEWVKLMKK